MAAFQDQIINPDQERKRVQESIQADAAAMHRRMSFDRPVDGSGAGAGDDRGEKKPDGEVGPTTTAGGQAINQLFAPPAFNSADTYYTVIEKAKIEAKWVLVNIQQAEVFASHQLNRDVWRDETISDIVAGSFIFWQRDDKSTEGVQFCSYHNCGHQLPHICVIDPRTGRRVKSWDGKKWVESHAAAEYLFGFLDQFSMTRSPQQSPMTSPQASPGIGPQGAPTTGDMSLSGLDDVVMPEATIPAAPAPAAPAAPAAPIETGCEMPEEPAEGPECVKVSMRLPSGTRLMRRFLATAPVAEMFAVASAASNTPVSRVELASMFPKRSLRDVAGGLESMIKDAEVAGSQVMVTLKAV